MKRIALYDLQHCETALYELAPDLFEVRVVHQGDTDPLTVRVIRFTDATNATACFNAIATAYDDPHTMTLDPSERALAHMGAPVVPVSPWVGNVRENP